MNPHLLINAIVQQTMILVARLAASGGVRAPLIHITDQIFLELTKELANQGVSNRMIADMLGWGLRTFYRKQKELSDSKTVAGHTIWEAVLEFVQKHQPVSGQRIFQRFCNDNEELVTAALTDLTDSGQIYRTGRSDNTVYRIAAESDFGAQELERRQGTEENIIWLKVYREGPLRLHELPARVGLDEKQCRRALDKLMLDGKIQSDEDESGEPRYSSPFFEVFCGDSKGWEAAVLDHYQAMVSAILNKLRPSDRVARSADTVGGTTYSLDVHPGHPFEQEALGLLAELRARVADLRRRIDEENERSGHRTAQRPDAQQVIFYLGQYVKK